MIELKLNTIYQGHVLDVLKTFPDNYFSLIVCSPPYWGLRDYEGDTVIWDGLEDCEHEWGIDLINKNRHKKGETNPGKEAWYKEKDGISQKMGKFCIHCNAWKGQLGLEPDFNMFIDHLMQIFEECKRILRKDGALWVNLGDTYYGGGNASGHTDESKNFGLSTLKRGMVTNPVARGNQLKNKTLVGIPARFQIAMVDNGWICRNEIIWHKPNAMPSSVKDRFTVDFEKFFFFTKNKKYYFEQQFEPINEESISRFGRNFSDKHKHSDKPESSGYNISKYMNKMQEITNRQGMNKDRGSGMIRKRNLPKQEKFVSYMESAIWWGIGKGFETRKAKIGRICDDLDLDESKVEHWFRYDDSGFAYPSIEDWLEFQDWYETNEFPELVEYWDEPDTIDNNILGRNARTTWSIPTKPFPGAHFAVFPEELILPIIKSCVPKEICTRCEKPRKLIIEQEVIHNRENTRPDKKVNVEYSPKGQDHSERPPTDWKPRPILNEYLSDCGCNSKFEPGVVLDCFMGAGTTAVVASNQNKKWVGIELNPEYIEMSMKRINLNNKRLAKLKNIKHQQNRI